jgi:surfactin synthase thioesterase subunit
LARQLRRVAMDPPVHLYVSAARAPQVPDPEPPIHRLPEPRLIDKLRAMNGTPEEMLRDRDAIALYLPIVRADFSLIETYIHQTEPPLDCPLTVFGGERDETVNKDALVPWQSQTRRDFSLEMFSGDHFFIQHSRAELLTVLTQQLKQDLAQLGQSPAKEG